MRDNMIKRDPSAPGAILNMDRQGLAQYKEHKRMRSLTEQRLNKLEDDLASLKGDVSQVLDFLRKMQTNSGVR